MWIDSLTTDLTVRFSACVRTNDHTARRHSTSHRGLLNIPSNVGGYPGAVSRTSAVVGVRRVDCNTDALRAASTKRVPLRSLGQPSCLTSDLAPLSRSRPVIPLAPSVFTAFLRRALPAQRGKAPVFLSVSVRRQKVVRTVALGSALRRNAAETDGAKEIAGHEEGREVRSDVRQPG
jgi:hypothetical protein